MTGLMEVRRSIAVDVWGLLVNNWGEQERVEGDRRRRFCSRRS